MTESEIMFRVPRDFDPSSDLLGYLRRHCPEKVKTTGPYFLGQIVQALHQVIQSRGLYDEGNPFIVLCDEEMKHVFGVTAFHVSEICTRVASHLTLPIETDPVPESNGELIDINQLKSPSWGSEIARARFAKTIPIESHLFRVQPDFLKILRLVQGVDQTRIIFDFNQVANIFMKYVLENPQRIFDFRNVSVALVGGTPLGDALSIKAFARSQVRGIICSQLLPIPAEESMYLFPGTSRCKSEELRGSKPFFGRRKRNSRSKDLSVLEKSSEEETIYSAQGYETAAIGDSSASEISSSDDTFSQTYRDQYEVDDSSEEQSETNHPDSDEDSDVKDVAINTPLMQTSDFSNWADSDGSGRSEVLSSSSTSDSDSSSGNSECIPPSKCVWCKGPIRRFLQYCQPCWDERKSWLAVRRNPRKRKRALISKSASARRPRTISDEPEPSYNEVVVLGRSISDPSPSTPLRELNEVEPTAVTASSGIGSLCSSQELSSFESGPSQDLILRLETSEDESHTEEKARKRMQEENIYPISKIPKIEEGSVENELIQNVSNPGPSEKLNLGLHSLNGQSPLCGLCCSRTKDASFVHGRTSHQISCYPCAKKIFKNRGPCPVCRRRIEKITKHFVF